MCLVALAWDARPDLLLAVAANRDEFHDRPSAPAGWWKDAPGVLAGRDLRGGGTWMGVTRRGRFAALTNFRDPSAVRPQAPSRGALVARFLAGDASPAEHLERVAEEAAIYSPFNLLAGDLAGLMLFESRAGKVSRVAPGVHGLSNDLMDTPWPKVRRATRGLERLLDGEGSVAPEALMSLLADRTPAPDEELPRTGVGIAWERLLSPAFIVSPRYGTRSSTVLLVSRDGRVALAERTFDAAGAETSNVAYGFAVEGAG